MDACRHAPPAAYPGTMRAALSPPYLALLQAGFAVPWLLPAMRCALTAPFHPYLPRNAGRRYAFCCTFRRFAPPRRYLAPCPEEPGLSSARLERRQSAPTLVLTAIARLTPAITLPQKPGFAPIGSRGVAAGWTESWSGTLPRRTRVAGFAPRCLGSGILAG